jgi:hypothetical protein
MSKWDELKDDARYVIVDLGRAATFLLPSHKLQMPMNGRTVEEDLREFLTAEFGAFTTTTFPTAGFWRANNTSITYDECRQYEVSFLGKDRIPDLLAKVAEVAVAINEICIYFKAGQYTCLVYPPKTSESS